MASVTDGAMKKGAHAGNLIKAIAGLVGWRRRWPPEHGTGWRKESVWYVQQPLKKRQK